MLDDRRAKSKPGPFKKGPVGAPDKENDPAAVAYRAYRDGADREEFKQGVEDDAKKKGGRLGESEELEEIKGAMGGNIANLDREGRRRVGGAPGTSGRSEIHNVAFAPDESETDDDYYVFKNEIIDGMLDQLDIDPQSQEGMDLRVAIKAAAEKFSARSADRRRDVDPLAAKAGIKKRLGLGEAEEFEEAQEMEQISESFRRYTKILKD
jgi:hypothetical protein